MKKENSVKANTNNNIDNTKEVYTMTANNSNTTLIGAKRITYSKDMLKRIIADIEAGMDFSTISEKYGIKAQRTIKNWLDVAYPVKKAIVRRIWEQLKDNNSTAKAEAKAKAIEFVIPMAPCPKTTISFNDADFIQCFEDWWGDDEPLIDVLIDCRCDKDTLSLAVSYCLDRGLLFRISERDGSYINIQALAFGKPLVITTNHDSIYCCKEDDIEFLPIKELIQAPKVVDASNDFQYNHTCVFACMSQGKNGVFSCRRTELCAEFKKQHSIYERAMLEIYIGNRKAPERMGLKEGHVVSFVVSEGKQTIVWKYELKGKVFYETEYFSGGRELRKIFSA